MSEGLGQAEFNKKADEALCDFYGTMKLRRGVVDGQNGYVLTLANGCSVFYFKLEQALRTLLEALGHGEDRDIMVFGEEGNGNVW